MSKYGYLQWESDNYDLFWRLKLQNVIKMWAAETWRSFQIDIFIHARVK